MRALAITFDVAPETFDLSSPRRGTYQSARRIGKLTFATHVANRYVTVFGCNRKLHNKQIVEEQQARISKHRRKILKGKWFDDTDPAVQTFRESILNPAVNRSPTLQRHYEAIGEVQVGRSFFCVCNPVHTV